MYISVHIRVITVHDDTYSRHVQYKQSIVEEEGYCHYMIQSIYMFINCTSTLFPARQQVPESLKQHYVTFWRKTTKSHSKILALMCFLTTFCNLSVAPITTFWAFQTECSFYCARRGFQSNLVQLYARVCQVVCWAARPTSSVQQKERKGEVRMSRRKCVQCLILYEFKIELCMRSGVMLENFKS